MRAARPIRPLALVAACAALVVAGCGDGRSFPPQDGTSPAARDAAARDHAAAPSRGEDEAGGGPTADNEDDDARGGSREDEEDAGEGGEGRLSLKSIGRFDQPLALAQPPDDPRRLFVVEKTGRIRVVRGGRILEKPFLSLRGKVSGATEQGLLGLAFAPSYRRTRLFYIAFTDRAGDLRIEEWKRSKRSRDRANSGTRRLVLEIPQPRDTHNGGNLVFGPDGLLYIGVGDGGGPGDPRRVAQDRSVLYGKILRIDPRKTGDRPYRVPTTNPFVDLKGARDEIYAYGLRNPWRFSFDRKTGAFVMGDVGQETFEELNYRPRGTLKGANFGWSAFEGNRRFNEDVAAPKNHVPPMHTYGRDRGCSVTAGPVVRDPGLPSLEGRMLYSDFCSGEIASIKPKAPRGRLPRREGLKVPLPASFAEDRKGRVYVISLEGEVFRLVEK